MLPHPKNRQAGRHACSIIAAAGSMQGRRQIVLVSGLVSVRQIVKLGTPIYMIAS